MSCPSNETRFGGRIRTFLLQVDRDAMSLGLRSQFLGLATVIDKDVSVALENAYASGRADALKGTS